MPKVIIADEKSPDIRKAWSLHLDVDESVLTEINDQIDKNDYPLLSNLSIWSDDFVVMNKNIFGLRSEISKFILQGQGMKIKSEVLEFLYALDGLCMACEKTRKNLYGFAD
jgi:hypothetical protein